MPTSIVPSRLGEILDNLGYVAIGFGIGLTLIVGLLGLVFKLVSEKFKTDRQDRDALRIAVNGVRQDVALLQQAVDSINDHDEGRASFTKGLYSVSERITAFQVIIDRVKLDLRDLFERCERRHVAPASYEEHNRRDQCIIEDPNFNEVDGRR